jgi:hypothetical protein
MTELPPEMLEALQTKEQAQMKHSWMYSFMPVRNEIFLVGYCKVCDTVVSSIVPYDIKRKGLTMRAYIPKWGCVPLGEL